MKTKLIILSLLLTASLLYPQKFQDKEKTKVDFTCQTCHTTEVPTRSDPGLVSCPREQMATVYARPESTPEVIKIEKLGERYGPVYFSHRIHAQMSEMGGGCVSCHHFNTTGPILKCSHCHEPSRKRTDVSIPDLKAAYHRQCMDCHREWSHSTACNSCHVPIKDYKALSQEELKKKYIGRDHPAVVEPVKILYQTKTDEGKLATFYHDDHTKKFRIDCATCHMQEGCSSCHDVKRKVRDDVVKTSDIKLKLTFEEQHKNCISCHKDDSCSRCHSDKPLEPFNHQRSTGWSIKTYHAKLTCQQCHGTEIPFRKISGDCLSCHKNWTADNFDHDITGFKLDDMHLMFGCEDCHTNNNYAVKPSCDSCHGDEYVYPKDKPGKVIKR